MGNWNIKVTGWFVIPVGLALTLDVAWIVSTTWKVISMKLGI